LYKLKNITDGCRKTAVSKKINMIFTIILFSAIFMQSDSDACKPEKNISMKFMMRHGVAPYEFEKIMKSPAMIEDQVEEIDSGSGKLLVTRGDYHAIFPIKKEKLAAAITDYEHYASFMPRVANARVICRNSSPVPYYKCEQYLKIKFLGIGVEYNYIVNIYSPVSGDKNVFATKWNLEESIDGAFADCYGSWYLKEFEKDGQTYTYMRYFLSTVFKKYNSAIKFMMRNFAENDIKALFKSVYSEALKK